MPGIDKEMVEMTDVMIFGFVMVLFMMVYIEPFVEWFMDKFEGTKTDSEIRLKF